MCHLVIHRFFPLDGTEAPFIFFLRVYFWVLLYFSKTILVILALELPS